MSYILTKSKIIADLQCHKRLWFDINAPIRVDSHAFHILSFWRLIKYCAKDTLMVADLVRHIQLEGGK